MHLLADLISDPRMLPGDFVIDGFDDSAIIQLCATGMKLYPIQKYMLERYQQYGGQEMADTPGRMVAWLLDAFCHAPRDSEAVASHGDIAYACGPTKFLSEHLCIITDKAPWPGAPPLPCPTDKAYYMTTSPTSILEKLRCAFEHGFPRVVVSTAQACQVQQEVNSILSSTMPSCSTRYSAPQLSKKLVHQWSSKEGWSGTGSAVCTDIAAVAADVAQGLSLFHGMTPAATLESVFQVPAFLWAMWYCLVNRVPSSPEAIADSKSKYWECFLKFHQQHGFAPSPYCLDRLVMDGESVRKKRRTQVEGVCAAAENALTAPGADSAPSPWDAAFEEALGMQLCARPAAPAGDEEDEEDVHLIQGSASESAQAAAISEDAEAWVVIAAHIPALQRLTADRDQAVAKEDFCLAESFRNKIAALVKETQKAAVCLCCFVEAPSAVARKKGPEPWTYAAGFKQKLLCSHCTKHAIADGSARHLNNAVVSLERRTHAELKMALTFADEQVAKQQKGKARGYVKQLKEAVRDLKPSLCHGQGMKHASKDICKSWLQTQLYRTCHRVALEPSLYRHLSACRTALRLLEAL